MDEELARTFLDPGSEASAVFADELQARGDPRGELIALELRLDQELPADERAALERAATPLRQRYHDALVDRLGLGQQLPWLCWRFGYVASIDTFASSSVDDRVVCELLEAPEAALTWRLRARFSDRLRKTLSARARPLRNLALEQRTGLRKHPPPVTARMTRRLAQALPQLRELSLAGRGFLEHLSHPRLESLVISGHDCIADLGRASHLPALRSLDLALLSGKTSQTEPDDARIAELVSGVGMPGLRRLDLSRNHRGAQRGQVLGGSDPGRLFASLAASELRDRLDELVLPTPPDERALGFCRDFAGIAKVTIPRFYRLGSFEAARVTELLPGVEIGSERLHRPAELFGDAGNLSLAVEHGDGEESYEVSFGELVELYELAFDWLTAQARTTLEQVIVAAQRLAYDEDEGRPLRAEFPIRPVQAAIAELIERTWPIAQGERMQRVGELLTRHVDHAEQVIVTRFWGW